MFGALCWALAEGRVRGSAYHQSDFVEEKKKHVSFFLLIIVLFEYICSLCLGFNRLGFHILYLISFQQTIKLLAEVIPVIAAPDSERPKVPRGVPIQKDKDKLKETKQPNDNRTQMTKGKKEERQKDKKAERQKDKNSKTKGKRAKDKETKTQKCKKTKRQ